MDLARKKCIPCEVGAIPLASRETEGLIRNTPGWELYPNFKKIYREFKFKNFAEALAFTNKVGEIAESEGHHPDIKLSYGKVLVELWTHAIDGLSENDFIVAAKINKING